MQQTDYLTSSQLVANYPQMNSTRGPSLIVDRTNPIPTYNTVYSITLQNNITQEILITLLSKQNVLTVNKVVYGDLIATCSSVCERLDDECYGVRLIVTGVLPINQISGTGKIQLEISGYGTKSVWINIDFMIQRSQEEQLAMINSQQNQILPVQVNQINIQQDSLQNSVDQLPIHQSLRQSDIQGSQSTLSQSKLTGSVVDLINSPDYVPVHQTLRDQKLSGSSIVM